ncbi:hypothetical protein SEA_BONUM_72 [Gordonia phage Bonum]|uniref:Uncharacterized protein n=1 Tax=Gordonia phage Kabluna TaxID=2041511 RepID=A0A2D1GD18_9CAUD|nr:hypothetical protein KNT75_gp71 [Gordonia phage Kabluna]ATN89592.1 hypothetical protein SEA_KABLUNA_71 [Gordonia phage Kabluna]QXN73377.1 hypothetical protein SEA_BONUM_72 [Gordonia phage Bonum]
MSHRGVDPAILAYVRNLYGPVDERISTLVYEQGSEGTLRRFVGYVVVDTSGPVDMDRFVTFLPIRDPDERDENKAVFNYPMFKHVHVLRVNVDRVISIMEEVMLP